MTMRNFIKRHRTDLDDYICQKLSCKNKLNDIERKEWILNDEYLYRWAKSEKVPV